MFVSLESQIENLPMAKIAISSTISSFDNYRPGAVEAAGFLFIR